jgi:PRTRC genetic system protein E
MLKEVARFLRGGERLEFFIKREPNGQLYTLVTPVLGPDPAGADDEAKQMRALLARAIVIRGTDEQLDQEFEKYLNQAADVRDVTVLAVEDLLASLKADAEKARSATAKRAGKSSPKKTSARVGTKPEVAPAAEAPAEDSTEPLVPTGDSAAAPKPSVNLFEGSES